METDTARRGISRRRSLNLLLAGVALPATRALAAPNQLRTVALWSHRVSIRLESCSGEAVAAEFEDEMAVSSDGKARGSLRFVFEDRRVVDYLAELGGLDLDASGQVLRAWLLLRERTRSGKLAQDYALVSVAPEPDEDCLIYTTAGSQPYPAPSHFEVPGTWEVRRDADR